jgi:hypothetical protein
MHKNRSRTFPASILESGSVSGEGSFTPSPGASYSDEVLADNPTLYWKLNEASGAVAVDSSGNGRNGTKSGNAQGSRTGPVAGDDATDCDGAAGTVITSTYNPFTNGTVRTFEAWVLRDGISNDGIFGSSAQFMARAEGASTVRFDSDTTGGFDATWAGVTLDTTWHHIVLVFDEPGDTVELFYDGVSQTAKAFTGQWQATPGNFQVARRGGSDPLDGGLAHVAVYESALSAARILAHYNAAGA